MSLENYTTKQSKFHENNFYYKKSRGLKSITEQILLSDEYQELKGSKTNTI